MVTQSIMPPKKKRAQRDREEHEFAMADLQDAVDRTGDGGTGAGEVGWKENLNRARTREQDAHDAIEKRRKPRRAGGGKD